MNASVTIVDYGSGNLYSVARAFEHVGATVKISDDAHMIAASDRVVLPGVGAFSDGMAGLRERGLVDGLRRYAASGRPMLGICLGMQMLATMSEEFGEHEGLGLIPGCVKAIPDHDTDGHLHKIPHIGWASLHRPAGCDWSGSLLQDTPEGTPVYLVHSFAVAPVDKRDRLAECMYGGHPICTAVRRGRVCGSQFHPEKSGPAGLQIIRSFLSS